MKINKNGVLYESVSIMTRVSLLKGLIIRDLEFGIYNRTYIFHGFLRKLVWVIPYDSLSEPYFGKRAWKYSTFISYSRNLGLSWTRGVKYSRIHYSKKSPLIQIPRNDLNSIMANPFFD